MARGGNYAIQANQAKHHFLTYDQSGLIRKFSLIADEKFLYTKMLCQLFRISRTTGDIERRKDGAWIDGNSYEEVMTLLDLLCDSRADRSITGRWKNMASFGHQFHQNLLETRDLRAERIEQDPEGFCRRCEALGGHREPGADISYSFRFFDGLPVCVQFWHGDEEFFPRIRFLWDENAGQYLRYETMYFAVELLIRTIWEEKL